MDCAEDGQPPGAGQQTGGPSRSQRFPDSRCRRHSLSTPDRQHELDGPRPPSAPASRSPASSPTNAGHQRHGAARRAVRTEQPNLELVRAVYRGALPSLIVRSIATSPPPLDSAKASPNLRRVAKPLSSGRAKDGCDRSIAGAAQLDGRRPCRAPATIIGLRISMGLAGETGPDRPAHSGLFRAGRRRQRMGAPARWPARAPPWFARPRCTAQSDIAYADAARRIALTAALLGEGRASDHGLPVWSILFHPHDPT